MIGKSICAGIAISLGCMANLMAQDRLTGAVLFGVGLLAVCIHGLILFTGTVCRADRTKVLSNLAILLFNSIGVLLAAAIFWAAGIETRAAEIVAAKLAETPSEVFARAALCNILICLAVDEWNEQRSSLMVLFPVAVFVSCGYEHCVANLFYMMAACTFDAAFFAVNVVGNAAGGIMFWRLKRF